MIGAEGRPAMITLVIGETDVGKSHWNRAEAAAYCQNNYQTGKKAGKVLAFDNEDDDYPTFQSVDPDHIRKLKLPKPRRIRPYVNRTRRMTKQEKKEVVKKIVSQYENGLLILDDIDGYMSFEKGQDMVSALMTLCHKGVDMILSHQSIGRAFKDAIRNCTWIRLYHCVEDISEYKARIPKYPLVRIAQFVVNEQYDKAYDAYKEKQINKHQFKVRSSFYIHINVRKGIVRNCSKRAFVVACKKYIDQEEGKKVRSLLKETDFKGKKLYKNQAQVITKMISDYLRHFEDSKSGVY